MCNAPTPPRNGVIDVSNQTTLPYGHLLDITCQKGYNLVGNHTIKCVGK